MLAYLVLKVICQNLISAECPPKACARLAKGLGGRARGKVSWGIGQRQGVLGLKYDTHFTMEIMATFIYGER